MYVCMYTHPKSQRKELQHPGTGPVAELHETPQLRLVRSERRRERLLGLAVFEFAEVHRPWSRKGGGGGGELEAAFQRDTKKKMPMVPHRCGNKECGVCTVLTL